MGKKIERLNHNLDSIRPDIAVLTEHGLNDNSISNVNLINYRLVTSYIREFHRKAGVAIFARDSFGSQLETTRCSFGTVTTSFLKPSSCCPQEMRLSASLDTSKSIVAATQTLPGSKRTLDTLWNAQILSARYKDHHHISIFN
ncbi:hypothetical protein J6590_098886 [Homalodisca vitripennis]|nr:hypothetical protein J6590_098886 [Homalodisca vitripennis]